MIDGEIEKGMLVRHERTEGLYRVQEHGICKIDEAWQPVVIYRAADRDTTHVFVRETAAFRENFEIAEFGEMYFLQDKRSFVGNCPVWWAKDNKGYTTQIELAHRYTKEQAFAQHKSRETDVPWPCSVVMPHAKLTIDVQDLHKTEYARTALGMVPRY